MSPMNPILGVPFCVLLLTFKIPLVTLEHIKYLVHKDERTPPTLFQRIICVAGRTFSTYLPLSVLSKLSRKGAKKKEQQKHWVKKLDMNNEDDGWEGYLVSESAEQSEIGNNSDTIILYAHGGAFIGGFPLGVLDMFIDWIKAWKSNHNANIQILTLEYRLAPEYPFPAARDNILACYNWLVTEKNINPSKIVLAGDSAGGNLAVTSALYLINNPRKFSIDPPAALVLLSPIVSLITTAKSFTYNHSNDFISPIWLNRCIDAYIGDANLHSSSPLVSPLFEDKLSGLPKVLICTGNFEVLLDDVKAFHDKLKQNNVTAELIIEDANIHGYAILKQISRNGAYERSIGQIGNFLFGN